MIDTVSGDPPYAVVREGGHLVTLQTPPNQAEAERYGITAVFFIVTADTGQLTRLAEMVDERGLRVTVAATYPLSDGACAYARRSAGPGKTVLTV